MVEHVSITTASPKSVGLVIPTLNAGERWVDCLVGIGEQTFKVHRLLNIDSMSTDQTTVHSESAGFEVVRIDRSQFNHGGTRQWAAEYLNDCDIIVFMTQDAILANRDSLAEIVGCFDDPEVAVAYKPSRKKDSPSSKSSRPAPRSTSAATRWATVSTP